ncbi:MAG: 30S ribosomal protein S8 [Phycisphaerales bacterium]|jgi:small subunit ribosomal protein S8|nr:30S ribosomal protein S8 [Phycisphaerales bacterium]MDP6311205.1 30S ribosomal protein S8 [Phycisphaerales bacterium]MDP7086364.1 30S ribosomal protein S8 [Phycisphaerales bacterium]MDP7189350.1 30S ribosomal protein S8 [Phycisphaerales bacterium]MDP7519974.1 30S ribosomal protein S8 [Phycisphaerales bacterium]|tara:strand:+ start:116 stop:514 length:399 start_codon:yes stop_codon:yes gene_type:complete
MSQQDLTADMLTRIRNAVRNHAEDVVCLDNRLNRGVAQVLQDEGFINDWDTEQVGARTHLRVRLKYGPRGEDIIRKIKRVSKPGCRVYSSVDDIPRPMQGLGIAIVSTSSGVMSDRRARSERVGGELVAIVS